MLIAPHIALLHCNNLNPAILLPSVTDEVPHDCLMLVDHLLSPCEDLQEASLGDTDFSWLTDSSYLKDDNGNFCAGYVVATTTLLNC